MTRWQGTTMLTGLRPFARPTARARPSAAASSQYERVWRRDRPPRPAAGSGTARRERQVEGRELAGDVRAELLPAAAATILPDRRAGRDRAGAAEPNCRDRPGAVVVEGERTDRGVEGGVPASPRAAGLVSGVAGAPAGGLAVAVGDGGQVGVQCCTGGGWQGRRGVVNRPGFPAGFLLAAVTGWWTVGALSSLGQPGVS